MWARTLRIRTRRFDRELSVVNPRRQDLELGRTQLFTSLNSLSRPDEISFASIDRTEAYVVLDAIRDAVG